SDLCTQAEGWRELDPTIAVSGALDLEHDRVQGFPVIDIQCDIADANFVQGERRPVRRHVRFERDLMLFRIDLQAEQTAHDGADYHRGGPDLVRRTGGKRLVIIS